MNWIPLEDEMPRMHEFVLVLTTDADGDPFSVTAHWNGAKTGFLGTGGRKVKPATHWIRLPPYPEQMK